MLAARNIRTSAAYRNEIKGEYRERNTNHQAVGVRTCSAAQRSPAALLTLKRVDGAKPDSTHLVDRLLLISTTMIVAAESQAKLRLLPVN